MKKVIACLLCCSLLSSCAFSRLTAVKSTPPGASVRVDGETQGETPFVAKIGCKAIGKKELEVSKDGYRTLSTGLEQKASGRNIFWSIFFAPAGLIFLFFVAKCPRKEYHFTLQAETAELKGRSTLTIMEVQSNLNVYVADRPIIAGRRMVFSPGWQDVSAEIGGEVRRVGEILLEADRDYAVELTVGNAGSLAANRPVPE